MNRKEIVESEDSDKLSSEGENSDDYDPDAHKKKKNQKFRHQDSDSDDAPAYTPSPPKPQRKRPARKVSSNIFLRPKTRRPNFTTLLSRAVTGRWNRFKNLYLILKMTK